MEFKNGKLYADDGEELQNMHDYLKVKSVLNPIYDYNTKNKSFLNVHTILKKLGIKNNNEHLQLYNKELLGIDPFDANLSNDIRRLIDKECRMNLWYFLREIVKLDIGGKLRPFELNIGSFTATFLICRRQNIYYEIARQIGKTLLLVTILAWLFNFGGSGINMGNMHHSSKGVEDNIRKIKSVLNNLPKYLQYHKKEIWKLDSKTGKPLVRTRKESSDVSRSIANKVFNNKIESIIVGGTRDSANVSGRGSTRHIYYLDEFAFVKFNDLAYRSLQQSTTTARRIARDSGFLHGIWITSTPGDLQTPHGRWIYGLIKNEFVHFTAKQVFLFDYTEEELNDYIAERSVKSFWFIKYDWRELGFSEEWFFDKNRNADVEEIRREVLLFWEETNHQNPFTRAQLANLEQRSQLHKDIITDYDDYNKFTLHPRDNEVCNDLMSFLLFNFYENGILIGVDVANGTGGDYSTMVFLDAKTLRVIATYRNNVIDTDDFALLIIDILERIIQRNNIKCAVQIERNNSGTSVLARIKKMQHLQKYLIAYPVSEAKLHDYSRPVDFEITSGDMVGRYDFGFNVTPGSRKLLTESLLVTLVKKHSEVYSVPEITSEVKSLVIKNRLGSTRIEAGDTYHDDMIFASLHAYYMAYYAVEILERRHKIIINPNNWIISKGVNILSGNNGKKRIYTQFIQGRDGKIKTIYYDSYRDKIISEDEVKLIDKEEKNKGNAAIVNTDTQNTKEIKYNNKPKINRNFFVYDDSFNKVKNNPPIELMPGDTDYNNNSSSFMNSLYSSVTTRRK